MKKNDLSPEQKKAYAKIVRELHGIINNEQCMAKNDDCSSSIIRSHTISKSRYLIHVTENNHVLQRKPNMWALSETKTMSLAPVGINDASTFNGFCGHHDNVLFSEIDESEFIASPSQLFIQAYRTHARELYCKEAQIVAFPKPESVASFHGKEDPESYVPTSECMLYMVGMDVGMRDTLIHHSKLISIRDNREFWRMRSCVIPLSGTPIMASAGAFYPDFNFEGKQLQDFSNQETVLDTIHFNLLPTKTGAYAIFSFLHDETKVPEAFINNLLEQDDIAEKIVLISFYYVENSQYLPSWWNNLNEDVKESLDKIFQSNINMFTGVSSPKYPKLNLTEMKAEQHFWI